MWLIVALTLLTPTILSAEDTQAPPTLEQRLLAEGAEALAKAARADGDAKRGAVLFHQPHLACVKCHGEGNGHATLGPDLAKPEADRTGAHLIESILAPSKSIKKGFETVTIATDAGATVTGLLADDRPDEIVLRDPVLDGKLIAIPKKSVDEKRLSDISIMPAGLANGLASRQEFLDLARYVLEVAEKGPGRALELRPTLAMLAPAPVPAYEKDLDHAGLLSALDAKSFERGEAIYNRVCINCHGNRERAGSLPTSLRFASGAFKNGSDPYRMYQTLTHGFGMMAPQTWMVPKQKYDVIHYIREAYLKEPNPSQFLAISPAYLARLPKGTSRGPEPVTIEPWANMNYGSSLTATYGIPGNEPNFAYKGIAIRLDHGSGGVSRGRSWVVYDHDTMQFSAAWTGAGFIDWNGINFNGRHEIHPSLVGRVDIANPIGPGWADPRGGRLTFDDPRLRGRDGRPYGPLPRAWSHFLGRYDHGDRVILAYTIGDVSVLESPGLEVDTNADSNVIYTRTLEIGPSRHDLLVRLAPERTAIALVGGEGTRLETANGFRCLRIPASSTPRGLKVLLSAGAGDSLRAFAKASPPFTPLKPLTQGGPAHWPEVLRTNASIGPNNGPFAVDDLTLPFDNPWFCQMRLTGFDFFPDGRRAAVCTWDGDVWLVDGVDDPSGGLAWRRIASGLFQPLGLKLHNGKIYVTCRDQIAILHDRNQDGEIDVYENFNSDHQVTEHFHEFAMDLQTDAEGNFYYAKAARHGKTALVPQHGTLLRVSKDGSQTDILATGFRAPNGVCLNGDGTFFLSDQEGFWLPKNRINWVKPGGFYGNMWGYHDVTDTSDEAMERPLCWITNRFDRSPAELLWVSGPAWAPLEGSLLNLSYGYGKIYVVPHEKVDGVMQGGMCELPIPQFPTGIMRARFHPKSGHLYTCGMFAWAGTQERPGGFYRVRMTGKPVYVPVGLKANRKGMQITFSAPLDRSSAGDVSRFSVSTWSLKRSERYGSDHVDEKPARVTGVRVSDDARTVQLDVVEMKPTWCMEIKYALKDAQGQPVDGVIHNTVHILKD